MRRAYSISASAVRTLGAWNSALATLSGLGFNTLLLTPPAQNIFTDALCDDLDVARLVGLASDRSLQTILDVRISSVPAKTEAARRLDLFESAMGARDPRIAPAERQNLPISFTDEIKARAWINILRQRLLELHELGVAGFCCRLKADTPEWILPLLAEGEEGEATNAKIPLWVRLSPLDAIPKFDGMSFAGIFLPATKLFEADGLARIAEASCAFGEAIVSTEEPPAWTQRLRGTDETRVEKRSKFLLWASAALGDGILVPMGFEYGLVDKFARSPGGARNWFDIAGDHPFDLSQDLIAANAFLANRIGRERPIAIWPAADGEVLATTRRSEDRGGVEVILSNPNMDRGASLQASSVSRAIGEFLPLKDALRTGVSVAPSGNLTLRAGEVRILEGRRSAFIRSNEPRVQATRAGPRLILEAVTPCVDNGRYAVKRIVGDEVNVECDAYAEGHDSIAVAMMWRAADETAWREKRMAPLGNDRWTATLPLERVGRYLFNIEAWRDELAIFRRELRKKHEAGLPIALELREGEAILLEALRRAGGRAADRLARVAEQIKAAEDPGRLEILLAEETAEIYSATAARAFKTQLDTAVSIDAERRISEFASWYELFPRSQSGEAHRHGAFNDVVRRLPAIRDMGFDVVYFPPIHPIGRTNRKGRNNTLNASPDDPGSPYAIGSAEGGHDAIHPSLGTFEDFQTLLLEARKLDLEIAIDFAIQASPDHPWLRQHPEWFSWRPDGTIRYAENPPKKYEDIVNFDFYADGEASSLWTALRDTIRFWVQKGVRLFRVDNPHTKPFPFWDWVIDDIRRDHPDVVFLAEAFTRPKIMYRLAKGGFSQSYTYFTWRETKQDLTAYLEELTSEPPSQFFRPHFFVNTPDINPDFLQNAPRSAFLIRAVLAATLSGLWGVYNGFELCEGKPDATKKEYANSEKYEIRVWDWDRPGHIIEEITSLNRIRRENPALHSHLGLAFQNAWNDNILFFEKATPDRLNVILVAISLDPISAQKADIEIPLWKFGLSDHATLKAQDLMREREVVWSGKHQRLRLEPELPFAIWRIS